MVLKSGENIQTLNLLIDIMVYLVGGIARSGKSIIRKKLLETYKISGIGTDTLRFMLLTGNPKLGIDTEKLCTDNAPLMWPYLRALIYELIENSAEDFIIEGDVLLPQYLAEYKDNLSVIPCFIGYADVLPEQKAKDINDNSSSNDWTKHHNLVSLSQWNIENSIKFRKECALYGVKYFDTGKDFEESINNVVDYLLQKIWKFT